MRASLFFAVLTAENQDITWLTVVSHVEVFGRLAEIGARQWQEEVGELALQTWRMKTTKNPHWDMMRDYIEDWRRGVLLATTIGYHNLVLR